jgi:hypothetical protein
LTFDGTTLYLISTSGIDGNGSKLNWNNGDTFWAGSDSLGTTGMLADMGASQVSNYAELANWNIETYNGLVLYDGVWTSSGSVTRGQLVAQRSDGTWELADADTSNSEKLLGIALDAVGADQNFAILLNGIYSTTAHDQLGGSPRHGVPVYISTTAGNVTETAPTAAGDYVRIVGHNIQITSDTIVVRFDPDGTWIAL